MIKLNQKGSILLRVFKNICWIVFLMLLLLWGCSKPEYKNQTSALIVIKSQELRYADMGFIYAGTNESKVEIYASGQALLSLTIHPNSICMDTLKCLSPQSFNAKFLSAHYPKEFLANVFAFKAIFAGENMIKKPQGFEQRIKNNNVDIEYRVVGKKLFFKDHRNNVLIKIKEQE